MTPPLYIFMVWSNGWAWAGPAAQALAMPADVRDAGKMFLTTQERALRLAMDHPVAALGFVPDYPAFVAQAS